MKEAEGTGAQPSEKSLSQTLHPGNSKQVHKTTTLPPVRACEIDPKGPYHIYIYTDMIVSVDS